MAVDLATMSEEDQRDYYRYLQLKKKAQGAAEPVEAEPVEPRAMIGPMGQGARVIDLASQGLKGLGYAAEGIADISDLVIEPAKTAFGGGTGKEIFDTFTNELDPFSKEEGTGDTMRRETFRTPDQPLGRAVEFLTKERFPNEADPGLKEIKTGAEWFGSMMGPGKFKDVATTAAVAGTGAAIGEGIGGEIGEMIGGLFGGVSNIEKWGPKTVKALGHYLRKKVTTEKAMGAFIQNDATERAIDFLKQNADNWEEALANLNEADKADIIGTLGDLTEDFQLMNIENVPKGSKVAHQLDETTRAREGQIIEQAQDVFGQGDPDAARKAAQMAQADELRGINLDEANEASRIQKQYANQVSDIQEVPAEAQRLAAQADEAAAKAEKFAVSETPPAQASTALSEAMGEVDAQMLAEYQKPAWKIFDDISDPIDSNNAKSLIDPLVDETGKVYQAATIGDDILNPTAKDDLKASFPGILKLVDKLGDTATPSQIHYIVQKAKNAVHQNKLNNKGAATPEARSLTIYAKKLEDLIKQGDTGDAYKAAVKATNERLETVARGTVADARALDPKLLGKELFKNVEQGAVTADDILAFGDEKVTARVTQYVRSVANRDGVDEKFLKKYGEFLEKFPGLKEEFAGVVAKKDQAKVLTEAAKAADKKATAQTGQLTQALKQDAATIADTGKGLRTAVSKTIVNDYGKDPAATIKKLLTNPDDIEKLPELINAVGPENAAGVNRAIGEAVSDIVTSSAGTRRRINYKALDEFEKIRPQLEQIMEPKEFEKLFDILKRTRTSELRKMSALQRVDMADSEIANLGASAAAASVVGFLPGTQSLLVGGAVRRYFRNHWFNKGRAKTDPNVAKALDNILSNPRKYIEQLNKAHVDTPEKFNKFMATMIGGIAQQQEDKEEQ